VPPRVAIVAASPRIVGGHAVQAGRLIQRWRNEGTVEAWLVPIDPEPPRALAPALRVKYLRTVVTQLLYWPLLLRELRRADVVHVFSASYTSFLLAPLPAFLVGKLLGKPVIVNYRSGEAPDHLRRSRLARAVLRRTDLNIVPSRFLADVFAQAGLAARIVPNTIDLARFPYRERTPLRPQLLSTRNFEGLYNVACTLRAFARVQRRYPAATLTLVGSGSEEHRLKRLAIELGLRHVTFTGSVPAADIHTCYRAADIYVQTPSIDNMPGSVLEAFASGLPVVSTNVGGVPAILTDGVHGLLAADDDDEAVAERILTLLEQPELARQLARNALATCHAYEWAAVRGQWLDAYRAVVARREAPMPARA
jgi:glycosyltransferase involved in cell wall biosynthesis